MPRGKFRKGRGGGRGRDRRDRGDRRTDNQGDRRGNYVLAEKKNEQFEAYYKDQKIVPEGEFEDFLKALREPLPATFRITGSKREAKEVLKVIQSDYLQNLVNIEIEGVKMDPPKCLPWYPDGMAWQLNLERKTIRHCDALEKLKKFLVSETESGNISRQEAVSMLPPLLLDIQPHHKVLDMCAAPGSKTAQLVEFLHADENTTVPEGFVIGNDSDNKRCYLMVHQVKRLASPCFMIINHDASILPNLRLNAENETPKKWLNFDRVLADVPCSGDGTMRKNPDVWSKWTPASGHNLHGLQSRILRRGLEMLEVGGRLVYSTCSFNPVENEAVVANLVQKCEGAVEILDASDKLPGLKFVEGLTTWKVVNRKTMEWFTSFEEVPESLQTQIRPTMFPPPEEEAKKMNLTKCIRVLPHHQNTGGFFIAVLQKTKQVPWFNKSKQENGQDKNSNAEAKQIKTDGLDNDANKTEGPTEDKETASEEKAEGAAEIFEPPQKKRKLYGYKEDPFVFLTQDEPILPPVKSFFGIDDAFPVEQLLVRGTEGRKRNIYFTSKQIKTILECNVDRVKFVNMGIKVLNRSESRHVTCDFRLVQEGIHVLDPFIKSRRVNITKEDIVTILGQENPFISKCLEKTQEQLNELEQGGMLFLYEPDDRPDSPQCRLVFCGWKGKMSTRSFLPKYQRSHFLRLCGSELQEPPGGSKESSANQSCVDPTEENDMDEENEAGGSGDAPSTGFIPLDTAAVSDKPDSSCDNKAEVSTAGAASDTNSEEFIVLEEV